MTGRHPGLGTGTATGSAGHSGHSGVHTADKGHGR